MAVAGQVDYSERMLCEKCGMEKSAAKAFFMRKDHTREPLCKECLTMHINNKEPRTFEWILEKFDVPYVEEEWIKIYNREMEKKGKVGSGAVLGKYLRLMKISPWINYNYADTQMLAFKREKNKAAIAARIVENSEESSAKLLELQKQLDAGEISQEQFDTLSPITSVEETIPDFIEFKAAPGTEDDEAIMSQLSEEEVNMLRMKWGSFYKPTQWIRMEELYIKYENEYELNADREEALKQICKITIKEDEALTVGDINGFKALSAAKDGLRKSAKFTDAQNKENATDILSSIGELVALCEREGGIITNLPDPDEYPQDKIDFTLRDLKGYTHNFVANELGLGDIIESYIKKIEQMEAEKEKDLLGGVYTSAEEELEDSLTFKEELEYQNYLDNELEEEAAKLLERFGD